MSRPRFADIFMGMAEDLSKRSTCRRLAVGCVITSHDHRQVFSIGYNGNASGLPNDCDSDEPGNCGDLHAEENAVINCTASRETSKIVYCTHLPCKMCAKRLINLGGVWRVIYKHDYRIRDSLELLAKSNIIVYQFDSEDHRFDELSRGKTYGD